MVWARTLAMASRSSAERFQVGIPTVTRAMALLGAAWTSQFASAACYEFARSGRPGPLGDRPQRRLVVAEVTVEHGQPPAIGATSEDSSQGLLGVQMLVDVGAQRLVTWRD